MDPPAPSGAVAKKKGAENPNKVQQPNKKKGSGKKRKPARKKTPAKSAKRARRKDKTLKPATGVLAVPINASDHGSVLDDVGKAGGKATKKGKKSNKGKRRVGKAQAEPSGSGGGVGGGHLPVSGNIATDEVIRNESDEGLDGPRRSNDGGEDGEAGGAKAHLLDQKESHYSDWQLEAEPETEVGEENVEDAADVANIVNWEHYGLMFEEYCLTREVNYTKKQ